MKTLRIALVPALALAAVAASAQQSLYAADNGARKVYTISPTGAASTLVNLPAPSGATVDAAGNLYANGNGTLYRVAADGTATALATGFFGSLTHDALGNIYATSLFGTTLRRYASDGTATNVATIGTSYGLATDLLGNVYSSNAGSNLIQRITPAGVVTTFATGISSSGDLAFDALGNLYAGSYGNNTISKITPLGVVSTFATATSNVTALAFDASGNLYGSVTSSILRFGSDGSYTTFASGFGNVTGLAFAPAVQATPEPSAFAALGLGAAAMLRRRRK